MTAVADHTPSAPASEEIKARQPRSHRRTDLACLAALLLISLAVRAAPWPLGPTRAWGPIDLRWDGSVYWVLGTSLAEGKGYRLLNEPGEIQAVQYPPMLPLLIAGYQRFVGGSDASAAGPLVRVIFTVFWLGVVLGTYLLARRFLRPGPAFVAALLVIGQRWTLFLSDLCYAELPFTCVTLLFFAAYGGAKRWTNLGVAGGLLAIACLLRTAGVALAAAWVLDGVVRRRYREAAARALIAAVPILAWQGYVYSVEQGEEYRQEAYDYQRAAYQFSNVTYARNARLIDPFYPEWGEVTTPGLLARFGRNLTAIPVHLGETVSEPRDYWAWMIESPRVRQGPANLGLDRWSVAAPLIVSGFVLGGGVLLARRGEWLGLFYTLFSVVLICLTPWPQQFMRYLVPLAPLLVIAALVGLTRVGGFGASHRLLAVRVLGSTAVALVVVAMLAAQAHTLYQLFSNKVGRAPYTAADGQKRDVGLMFYDHSWEAYDRAMAWVRRHGARGDVVCTLAPHWLYLHTGLRAVQPPFVADPREFQRRVDTVPVEYLVTDDMTWMNVGNRYVRPALAENSERWRLVYQDPDEAADLRVYQRVRAATRPSDDGGLEATAP